MTAVIPLVWVAVACCWTLPASGQEMGIYSNWSMAPDAHEVYAWAQTRQGYLSAFDNDAYVEIRLFATPAGGSKHIVCQAQSRSPGTAAEASCSARSGGEVRYHLESRHALLVPGSPAASLAEDYGETAPPEVLPRGLLYGLLFREIVRFEERADEMARELKPDGVLRNHHRAIFDLILV